MTMKTLFVDDTRSLLTEGSSTLESEPAKNRPSIGAERNGPLLSSNAPFQEVCRKISGREFQQFQQLIYREAGIWLSAAKVALLTGRLAKRLRHHGLKTFTDYYALVTESADERVQMLDAISTNETHFFREAQHFELLKSEIFPQWIRDVDEGRRDRKIRVWSAGCSTGQEPYSLAMMLLAHFPAAAGWEIEIIATDLSTRALSVAKKGIWPSKTASEIPLEYLKAFMLKGFGEQTGKIKAAPELLSLVKFYRVNLNGSAYPFVGKFDLIFCRNVLIYFDDRSRDSVVRRIVSFLSPGGHFFVGHAESLHSMGDILSTYVPTVYRPARKTSQGGKEK
jgi:chemotaxis protein methyltransferase CheR